MIASSDEASLLLATVSGFALALTERLSEGYSVAKTITRSEARDRTRALVEELHSPIVNEQRWAIAQKHLDEEREEVRRRIMGHILALAGDEDALDILAHKLRDI